MVLLGNENIRVYKKNPFQLCEIFSSELFSFNAGKSQKTFAKAQQAKMSNTFSINATPPPNFIFVLLGFNFHFNTPTRSVRMPWRILVPF